MDGLLVVDKPTGPSSHDVVARVRRVLDETRIGHTGTLDPEASGVLPLVVGRATRLAQFLSGADKTYEATIRLGFATNTCDAAGVPVGVVHAGPWPAADAIEAALGRFRGPFLQQPPAYSAKKIDGNPSYKLARKADRQRERGDSQALAVLAKPVEVWTSAVDLVDYAGDRLILRVTCSAGFYVRALANDLGAALGIGGHLAALRRTRSGAAGLESAVPLADLEDHEHGLARATAAIIPMSQMLPELSALVLTETGLDHATHGRMLGPADFTGNSAHLVNTVNPANRVPPVDPADPVLLRLLSASGDLVGLAKPARAFGLLHPFIVLM